MGLEGSMWAPANRARMATVQKNNNNDNNDNNNSNNNGPHPPRQTIPIGPSQKGPPPINGGRRTAPPHQSSQPPHTQQTPAPTPQAQQKPHPQQPPPPAPRDALTITPAVPAPSPARAANQPLPAQELDRYTHIITRLNWKIPSLDYGYYQAAESIRRFQASECPIHEVRHQVAMFKLDFFEFYMLIERALVRILGVFGVAVTGQLRRRGADTSSGSSSAATAANGATNGDSGTSSLYAHAYHQNVIDALDDPSTPLHMVLGSEAVNGALQRAKDLRNLWKYAHIDHDTDDDDNVPADAFSLEQYELRNILETIISALAMAKDMAYQRVQEMIAAGETTPAPAVTWDFMTDAMDWEAI